ncbi:uncharacterized protein LOC113215088 [Frankliniella occidentalis]|uniref:Uncharacterized protein LOC113215088 n=1 Tax=Frankliniella occidentalis TaxID=133901 RepID=A0A6J1TA56_FRAOC|nr:uncharacterized protein LOC113215088 [Frankliniella occidentalis]
MERKTEHAYVAVLLLIRQQLMHWNFRRVVSDFEDAIINAFRYVFQIEVQGCYFHSVNAMGNHARLTISIQILHYFPEIKNIVRLCCVLPLLPQHLIQQGFEIIGEMAMEELNIFLYTCFARPYLEYIQYEWLYHATRGPTLSVSGSEHRTNNASESNNRRMKRSIGVHHPNIYHFIRHLVDFEDMALDNFNSLTGAILPNRHRNHESISNDAYIMAITSQLMVNNNPNDEQILTFLISAAVTLEDIFAELFH